MMLAFFVAVFVEILFSNFLFFLFFFFFSHCDSFLSLLILINLDYSLIMSSYLGITGKH